MARRIQRLVEKRRRESKAKAEKNTEREKDGGKLQR